MKKFNIKLLSKEQRETRLGILKLAYDANHSHIGSCFTSVDTINAVYKVKRDDEKFILSNGHAGMALYVVLQKYGKIKNPKVIQNFYIHPDRNVKYDIHVSTGSLGQGLPIALGMAIADRSKNVYCLISDGECGEGSIWETLRIIIENKVINLKLVVDANGWGGYDPIELFTLRKRLSAFGLGIIGVDGHNINEVKKALKIKTTKPTIILSRTNVNQLPFLKGQDAHYYVMNEEDYYLAQELLK